MRLRRAHSYFLPLLLLAIAAGAQQQPPVPGPSRDFTVPVRREVMAGSGVRVSLVPYGDVPLATVRLAICSGAVDEGPSEVWLSKLVADYLEQGTRTRDASGVALAAGGMGGALEVDAGDNEVAVGGTVIADSASAFVSLIGDVVLHPAFADSELPRLRANRLRTLAIALSQPRPVARARFDAQLYPGSPYGRDYPTASEFASHTTAEARTFYTDHVRTASAHLYVVGQFDTAAVERRARAVFGEWTGASPCHPPSVTAHAGRTVSLIDRPGAVQSTIILGLPVAPPTSADWIPLQATDALLGGAFMSRITANIREQKGYTYSPFSAITPHPGVAVWWEQADVTTNVTGASLKEIFGEIDRLRHDPPTSAELKGIQNYLAGAFTLTTADVDGLVGQLRFVDLYGLGDEYLSTYVRRVYSVTPTDLQRIATTYLDPSAMAIVVAGDRTTVAPQLAPYGQPIQ
jgi:zinc protease